MSEIDKIAHAFGLSIDRACEIASIPVSEGNLHIWTLQTRIFEVGLKYGMRLEIERLRDRGRDAAIEKLAAAITEKPMRDLVGFGGGGDDK